MNTDTFTELIIFYHGNHLMYLFNKQLYRFHDHLKNSYKFCVPSKYARSIRRLYNVKTCSNILKSFNMDSEDHSEPKPRIFSLAALSKEFEEYLKESGLLESLTAVLKVLYDMEERPADPLEFMRTNLTDVVIERDELECLQGEKILIMEEIIKMQEEILEMEKELEEFKPNESEE